MSEETEIEPRFWRVDHTDDGEPRAVYVVPRRDKEGLRELVRGIMDGSLYPSVGVPENLMGMVFMGTLLGAFRVPDELRIEMMGTDAPPLVPEDAPDPPKKPKNPKRPRKPRKPKLAVIDSDLKFLHSWGELEDDEDWTEHVAKVKATNKRRADRFQERLDAHDGKVADWVEACDGIDASHKEALSAFPEVMGAWEESIKDATEAKAEWIEKHDRIFKTWGSEIGCLIGEMKNTFPRSINGYPMFHTFFVVHPDDWKRIHTACVRESERMATLEV